MGAGWEPSSPQCLGFRTAQHLRCDLWRWRCRCSSTPRLRSALHLIGRTCELDASRAPQWFWRCTICCQVFVVLGVWAGIEWAGLAHLRPAW